MSLKADMTDRKPRGRLTRAGDSQLRVAGGEICAATAQHCPSHPRTHFFMFCGPATGHSVDTTHVIEVLTGGIY